MGGSRRDAGGVGVCPWRGCVGISGSFPSRIPPSISHSFQDGSHLFVFAVSQAQGSAQSCRDKMLPV